MIQKFLGGRKQQGVPQGAAATSSFLEWLATATTAWTIDL